ncbi:MAG: flagellar biosynthetic protein FliR [Armatimonadota bacterium]|nr:flagellar type III secretion system protein FliR [bacterium]
MDILGFGITQILTFLLVLSRVAGIFTSAPIFGNMNVAKPVRLAIAVALTLVFLPMAKYNAPTFDFLPFALALVKEAFIGILMGFLASMMFSAIQMAGAFIDLSMGFGMGQMVDPMTKEHDAVIGQLQNLTATMVFLAVNGHHLMIRGLAESFAILPLGQMSFGQDSANNILQMFAGIMLAALRIAAPVVGAIFLTDVALGILNRTVPQLNVFVVGFPVKLAVGLFATVAVLPLSVVVMTNLFGGLHNDLLVLLKHIRI